MKQLRTMLVVLSMFPLLVSATDKPKSKDAGDAGTLTVVSKVTIKSQTKSMYVLPVQCDGEGNVYVLTAIQPASQIVKLGKKGELLATFSSGSATDLSIMLADHFTITPDGEVYQLAAPGNTLQRAVLVFDKDGSYKSGIKLDTPPGTQSWSPYQIGVFSSGDLLISGLLSDPKNKTTHPFTGIFSSSGQFRQEITLTDDAKIQKMVEEGDSRISPQPFTNRAVSGGEMLPAGDGNMYLMRNAPTRPCST
jgi:hypothetical protein